VTITRAGTSLSHTAGLAAEMEQDAGEQAQSVVRQVAWRVLVALFGLIAHEAAVPHLEPSDGRAATSQACPQGLSKFVDEPAPTP
jgi:hypothetical protein